MMIRLVLVLVLVLVRVLVEGEQLTRDALVSLLNFEPDLRVVGEAADGRLGLVEVRAHDPDVVLLDLVSK